MPGNRSKSFSITAPKIAELERQRQMEEQSYRDSVASLEKAEIDHTLKPANIPNISVVQKPTQALRAITTKDKIALGLAGGGLALGLALAMLRELVLDRTVKRPLELETRLQIPPLLSIPHCPQRSFHAQKPARALQKSMATPETDTPPWLLGKRATSSGLIRSRFVIGSVSIRAQSNDPTNRSSSL